MKFLTDDIGEVVIRELSKAVETRVAVAFFSPDDRLLSALNAVPKLTVIVSEEFTVNNPYLLERLSKAKLRSVPPDSDNGKLHAKVLIAKRANGSFWCLVGSANLTWPGLFSNQEACVVFESRDSGDAESVAEIRSWFDSLIESSRTPDLEQANLVFDARSRYRLERRSAERKTTGEGYWALKTTSGATGEPHWENFLAESVVAIGWSEIGVDPSKLSDVELRAAINKAYEGWESRAASKIKKFVEMKVGDIVLLCRGYAPVQEKPVHIHGLARVTGPFRYDKKSKWWKYKHDAVIQAVDVNLPKALVASALGRDSLRQTIHDLEKAEFDGLARELRKVGVQVEV